MTVRDWFALPAVHSGGARVVNIRRAGSPRPKYLPEYWIERADGITCGAGPDTVLEEEAR